MKKFLFLVSLLGSTAFAAPPVMEAPIKSNGTPVTISIDNSTLTKVPSSQTSGRIGIFIDAPSTNTGNLVGFLGNCTSTALASTIRPVEITPSATTAFYPLREDVCLWLITTHSGPENAHYQEVVQ